jgi:hypothetical protein
MPPISLSDDAMTTIMHLVQPLAPHDRSAFLHSLAQLLRSEPAQPVGDGIVHRHARALLASGSYRRADSLTTGGTAKPGAWHNGRSALRNGAPVGRTRSK